MTKPVPKLVPTAGVLPFQNLRNLDDWRAFIHQATPVIVTVLVTLGIVTDSQIVLWVPIFFAIVDPLLSFTNTTDKVRKIIYGVVGLLQSGGLIVGLAGDLATAGGQIAPVAGAALTVLTSFLARFYNPTNTLVPAP